jgi:hypothetical protein
MDDVQRKQEWEQAVESAQAIAGGFSSHCKQPDSAKPAFREFGAEYMRRAGAILDEARSHWIEVKKDGVLELELFERLIGIRRILPARNGEHSSKKSNRCLWVRRMAGQEKRIECRKEIV